MKQLKKIIFEPMQGNWQDVSGDSGTLADNLQRLGIIIDKKTLYARVYDNEQKTLTIIDINKRNAYIEIWTLD